MIGPWEVGAILLVVLIVFGVGKLPQIGSGLGEGIKNFKKSLYETNTIDVTDKKEEKKEPESK